MDPQQNLSSAVIGTQVSLPGWSPVFLFKNKFKEWGDCSVGKELALQAWGSKFNPQSPRKHRLRILVLGRQRQSGPWGSLVSQSILTGKLQVNETLSLRWSLRYNTPPHTSMHTLMYECTYAHTHKGPSFKFWRGRNTSKLLGVFTCSFYTTHTMRLFLEIWP